MGSVLTLSGVHQELPSHTKPSNLEKQEFKGGSPDKIWFSIMGEIGQEREDPFLRCVLSLLIAGKEVSPVRQSVPNLLWPEFEHGCLLDRIR